MARKLFVKNMGSLDRALRAFVVAPAALAAALALGFPSVATIVLYVVAGMALVTGTSGICPGYVPFGIDTHGRGRQKAQSFRVFAGVFLFAAVAAAGVVTLSAFTSWWVLFALIGVPPVTMAGAMVATGGSFARLCAEMPCMSWCRDAFASTSPAR